MIFKRVFIFATVLAIVIAGNIAHSFAKTYNAKVRSGKTTQIYRFSVFDQRDCGALAYPKTSFKTTSNGTITVKKFTGKLKLKGRCNGRIAKGMAVYYKSKNGFVVPTRRRSISPFQLVRMVRATCASTR